MSVPDFGGTTAIPGQYADDLHAPAYRHDPPGFQPVIPEPSMGGVISDNGLLVFPAQGSINRPTVASGGHRALGGVAPPGHDRPEWGEERLLHRPFHSRFPRPGRTSSLPATDHQIKDRAATGSLGPQDVGVMLRHRVLVMHSQHSFASPHIVGDMRYRNPEPGYDLWRSDVAANKVIASARHPPSAVRRHSGLRQSRRRSFQSDGHPGASKARTAG